MYELTNVEKCKKLPPIWKQFAHLKNNKKIIEFLRKSAKSPRPVRVDSDD